MFGHDKHQDDDDNDDVVTPSNKPVHEGLLGIDEDENDGPNDVSVKDTEVEDSVAKDDPTDIGVESAAELEEAPEVSEADSQEKPAPSLTPAVSGSDDLLDIKRQALHELSPIVSHLDQTPEEKFKTTMMMIQATDDKSLVSVAYEAAKQISSDPERAQALLDIVNEINYFTEQKKD